MLIIMQGAPGSGKTELARRLEMSLQGIRCSTDDFFCTGENHAYIFRPELLREFHEKNQIRVRQHLKNGIYTTAIVDNTNLRKWEVRPYVEAARDFGATVVFVRCTGAFQNVHGVPTEKVEEMRKNLEELSIEGCLSAKYPWEV